MSREWVIAVALAFWPLEAVAQEAADLRHPSACVASICQGRGQLVPLRPEPTDFLPVGTWWETFQAASRHVRAEYERHPLERYHYVHNDRLHPLVVSLITGYYSDNPYFFRHWYSSAKGTTPLRLAGEWLWLGIEFRRVLVFQVDRRYSGPFTTPEPCYAFGVNGSSLCHSITSFREGDRRFGVTLRIRASY